MSLISLFFIACTDPVVADLPDSAVDLRPKVRVISISEQRFSQNLQVPATIQALRSAVLIPRVPGRVSEVNVRIGDEVQENDLLLSLEGGDYLAGFQEAKAANELAQLQAEQAKLHLTRFENLHKDQAITAVQLEEASVNARLAASQAKRAIAGFEVAKNRLVDTELRAPFSGTIIARNIEEGEMLGGPVERPPLMLADLNTVRFIANIAESDISALSKGMNAVLLLPLQQQEFPVTIDRINSAVDPIVSTIQIEGILENDTHNFRHGQSAELAFALQEQQQLSLARSALLNRRDGQANVFVLREDGTIEKKEISYGRSDTSNVPILQGLEKGDNVLISGHTRLSDGDDVIVVGQE